MKKLLVKVTRKHINKGLRFNSQYCPVALALTEQIKLGDKQYFRVCSDIADIYIKTGKISYSIKPIERYYLPIIAQLFIDDFDRGKFVMPIAFELKVKGTW